MWGLMFYNYQNYFAKMFPVQSWFSAWKRLWKKGFNHTIAVVCVAVTLAVIFVPGTTVVVIFVAIVVGTGEGVGVFKSAKKSIEPPGETVVAVLINTPFL